MDPSHKPKSGFALVELLVAISIFAIVVTTVYTTLFISIKTYQRTQRELVLTQDINKILDKLSMELRNCYDAEYNEKEDRVEAWADGILALHSKKYDIDELKEYLKEEFGLEYITHVTNMNSAVCFFEKHE